MSDVWCPLPWVHQFVTTSGIKMCCNSTYEKQCTPKEFEGSDELRQVKESILSDRPHTHCNSCYEIEAQGFTSTRQNAIRDYPNLNKDNIVHKISYYDLRYNNLCNFSCRMCSPDFSSSIGNEVSHNPTLKKYYNKTFLRKNNYENIIDDISDNLQHVERLLFTGGEPLIIKDNLKILEKLVELGNTDCHIMITTNCSVINKDWLNAVKHFKNIHWTISLDGIGPELEYIRHGAVWSVIEKNIHELLKLNHSVALNATLSAYSVLRISKLVEFFIKIKCNVSSPFELWFGICQWPQHLSPIVLTEKYAEHTRQELEKSIELLASVKDNPERSLDDLKNVLKLLNTCKDAKLIHTFAKFTKELDNIRNQSFNKTFNLENPYV